MGVLLGLLVAACFGSGDFLGGLASRRAKTLAVLGVAQVAALALVLVVTLATGGPAYAHDVEFGVVAGLFNVAAIGCLYRGLALGQMGQVAPVAAVIGAVVPVAWGILRGESLSVPEVVGIVLAVLAGALLSSEPGGAKGRCSCPPSFWPPPPALASASHSSSSLRPAITAGCGPRSAPAWRPAPSSGS